MWRQYKESAEKREENRTKLSTCFLGSGMKCQDPEPGWAGFIVDRIDWKYLFPWWANFQPHNLSFTPQWNRDYQLKEESWVGCGCENDKHFMGGTRKGVCRGWREMAIHLILNVVECLKELETGSVHVVCCQKSRLFYEDKRRSPYFLIISVFQVFKICLIHLFAVLLQGPISN